MYFNRIRISEPIRTKINKLFVCSSSIGFVYQFTSTCVHYFFAECLKHLTKPGNTRQSLCRVSIYAQCPTLVKHGRCREYDCAECTARQRFLCRVSDKKTLGKATSTQQRAGFRQWQVHPLQPPHLTFAWDEHTFFLQYYPSHRVRTIPQISEHQINQKIYRHKNDYKQ